MIRQDLKYKSQCFYGRSELKDIWKVCFTDGTSAVVFYRIGKFFQRIWLGPLGWVFFELNKFLNGCVIGRGVNFDEGFVLMHPMGVVINGGVKGGKHIVVESGVVIGAAKNGLPVLVPKLGDNIFIGAGAKILGGITVGNNVKIGANAVVVRNVPDNVTVAGIPARVISGNEAE